MTSNISKTVIGLYGPAGAGKSLVADYLIAEHGYVRVKQATPLKDMLRIIGLSEAEIEGDLKEKPCELLDGQTPRYAMQTLGTEWGRNTISPNIWTGLWQAQVELELAKDSVRGVICDDVRFRNEAEAVARCNGFTIGINPAFQGYEPLPIKRTGIYKLLPFLTPKPHASENSYAPSDCDFSVNNNGGKFALTSEVLKTIRLYEAEKRKLAETDL